MGALTPADVNEISVAFELGVALVNVTAAPLTVPELQLDDKAPLHVPFVTVFPADALAARLANPAATALAAIAPVAVNVKPSTVTDCPAVRA